MEKNRSFKRGVLIFAAIALIFLTRLPGLMHNASLHPDEPVFYNSARNLALFLTGQADSYVPTKFYPEGGFTLHTPFQLLKLLFGSSDTDGRFIGRIAGCVYFLLGTAMGLKLLRGFFTKDPAASAVYLATMLFGLMHIEQSRYATGDSASFLFLMVLLYFSAKGMQTEKFRYFLLAAAFAAGYAVTYAALWRCPFCGRHLGRSDGESCPHCGKALEPGARRPAE